MGGNGRNLGSILLLAFALMVASPAWAATIDTIGSDLESGSPAAPYWWTAKGNAFHVDTDRILIEQEFFLEFIGPMTVDFGVYKSPVEFGTYQQVQANSVALEGEEQAAWYSSGGINVTLDAGHFYIMAVSFPDTLTYFYSQRDPNDEIAVSFSSLVHGFATGYHPLGGTIESTVNDCAVYYQRLTTIPEPATISLLALVTVAMIRRRR